MLRERGAHEQAAVAGAFDRQLIRVGVLLVDELAGTGGEVVEGVLALGEDAGAVPVFAEIAVAAQMADGNDAALFKPEQAVALELGVERQSVAAVGGEQNGALAFELDAL